MTHSDPLKSLKVFPYCQGGSYTPQTLLALGIKYLLAHMVN